MENVSSKGQGESRSLIDLNSIIVIIGMLSLSIKATYQLVMINGMEGRRLTFDGYGFFTINNSFLLSVSQANPFDSFLLIIDLTERWMLLLLLLDAGSWDYGHLFNHLFSR